MVHMNEWSMGMSHNALATIAHQRNIVRTHSLEPR